MEDLSIAQEFLLCAVNDKGRLPVMGAQAGVCTLAGGMIELIASGAVNLDGEGVAHVIGHLGENQLHLKSLHDWLQKSKPMKIEAIAQEYALSLGGKQLFALISGIADSLVAKGMATTTKGGIFDSGPRVFPAPGAVDKIVEKIRAELLEDGEIADETVALVSLLEKAGQLKRYFSAHEAGQLKVRLEEIRKMPSNQLVKRMMDYVDTIIAVLVATTIH